MSRVRSSARGGRRRMWRGGGGSGGAATRARGKLAVEVVELDGSPHSDDTKSIRQKTPTSQGITSGGDGEAEVLEANMRGLLDGVVDHRKLALDRRLKHRQMVVDGSNVMEENKAVISVEISQSFTDNGVRKLHPCRRSKRLCNKPTGKRALDGGQSEDDIFENSGNASGDEDRKLVSRRRSKSLRKKSTVECFDDEVCKDDDTTRTRQSNSNDDDESFGPCRRSKCLQYKLGTGNASNDEDGSDAVDDHRKFTTCRRSKRLQEKQKSEDVSNSQTEASCSSMSPTSSTSTSDEEFLCNTIKPHISTSGGFICSICESGVAGNLLIRCGSSCSRNFHRFCLGPFLQDREGTWACPLCITDQASLGNMTEEMLFNMKKIQRIVGHRRVILQESSFQYQLLVKWHGLSHHHDCWVPLEWLYVFYRLRVHSYLRKNFLLKEIYSEDQRKPEWFEVDRAIACQRKSNPNDLCDILATFQDNEDFKDFNFLVKWKGLDYCESTWESCCTEGVLPAVSKLILRHQNASNRVKCINQACLEGMVQREIHNDALYDYQLQGLQWIFVNFKARRNVILADEMGLGKTVQVVCFLRHIMEGGFTMSPALIIAPKSILLQWEKEFCRWGSDLNVVVYQGDKESRKYIKVHEMYSSEGKTLFDALVTSYEFVQLDKAVLSKFKWSAIVIDEAQRMKKLDCNLASCVKQYSSEFWLLLTGTPLQNNLLELFALLHYINPDEFSDPEAEADLFSIESGKNNLTLEQKVARVHDILKPRMLRRMKFDVLTDFIPTKKWVEVPCALTDSQRELYINILEKNYSKLNNAIQSGRKIALNCILMELKKCCNHPFLFPGQEVNQHAEEGAFLSLVAASGKLQLLQKLLPRLKERGNRVLIFSQMTRMLDILEDLLSYMGYKYTRIDGQTSLSARQESIREYNNVGSETFIFLMSTRAGGLGVDLPGADRVIIYDPDFNPFMDLQAQSRAHRIGQTRPVVVYQLITKCSVEEKILQKSKQKLAIENILMNCSKKPSADELQSILLHGAKTILDRKKVNATSIHYDAEAIENLLKLDPSPGEKRSSDDNGYLGSIVSFAHGVENEEPLTPKVDDLKVLQHVIPKVDLGRGKRQKKTVNYVDENSDSDDMYAPESSATTGGSTTTGSSSDDEMESLMPEGAPGSKS